MQTKVNLAASLSLRHLKAARCVADHGNVTRASRALNRTQSAITKSLNELEAQLGLKLFDRSPRGMSLTAHGEVFITRIREAESRFTEAGNAYSGLPGKIHTQRSNPSINPIFSMNISRKRLAAFLAVHDTRNITAAATRLGITRTAIYSSIRQLEKLLELRLFESSSPRLTRSDYCKTLATHVKLAFSLIGHAVDEMASIDGVTQGQVVIGALPYSRTLLIPRTIQSVLKQHSQLRISTREGPYDVLETSLRNGDIDLIIGATRRNTKSTGLHIENLFEDKLALIARAEHPAIKEKLTLEKLTRYGWILPPAPTPARQLFDKYVDQQGVSLPQQVVETSSLSTIRGLLLESDRIALLSTHQVYYDELAGLLVTLPIKLHGTFRPIGITIRANTSPSPAAKLFVNELKITAKEML